MSDDILRVLGNIEGELKGMRAEIQQHFLDDKENFGSIRKEVAGLQRRMWFGSGFAAACGALFGIFIKGHQ